MWMLKQVIFCIFLGVLICPQLSFSARPRSGRDASCPDSNCGAEGAGICAPASQGYVCTCRSGYRAVISEGDASCEPVPGVRGDQGRLEGYDYEDAGGESDKALPREAREGSTGESGSDVTRGDAFAVDGESDEALPREAREGSMDKSGSDVTRGDAFAVDGESGETPSETGEGSTGEYGDVSKGGESLEDIIEAALPRGPCASLPCGDPDAAKCIPAGNGYVCVCKTGHVPGVIRTRQLCLPITSSLCAENPCGKEHQCLQKNKTYSCACAPGFHSTITQDGKRPTCTPDTENDVCAGQACGPPTSAVGCMKDTNGQKRCICHEDALLKTGDDGEQRCIGGYSVPLTREAAEAEGLLTPGGGGVEGLPVSGSGRDEEASIPEQPISQEGQGPLPEIGEESTSGADSRPTRGDSLETIIEAARPLGECARRPCGDTATATCIPKGDGYTCVCQPGNVPAAINTLQFCLPITRSLCAENPCGEGHQCLQKNRTYSCACAPGFHSTIIQDGKGPTCTPDTENDVCAGQACGPPTSAVGCAAGANGQKRCVCHGDAFMKTGDDGEQRCIGGYGVPLTREAAEAEGLLTPGGGGVEGLPMSGAGSDEAASIPEQPISQEGQGPLPEIGEESTSGADSRPTRGDSLETIIEAARPLGECARRPCGDTATATCIPKGDSYTCVCQPGNVPAAINTLQFCLPITRSLCAENPCGEGHQCLQKNRTYSCACAPGFHSTIIQDGKGPTCTPDTENDVCAGQACGPPTSAVGCAAGADGQKRCVCHGDALLKTGDDGEQRCIGGYGVPLTREAAEAEGLLTPGGGGVEGLPMSGAGSDEAASIPEQAVPEWGVGAGEATGGAEGSEAGGIRTPGADRIQAGTTWGPEGPDGTSGRQQGSHIAGVLTPTMPVTPQMPVSGASEGEAVGGAGGQEGTGNAVPGRPEKEEKEEGGGGHSMAIAGGVIGLIILVAAAGGGAAMYAQKKDEDSGDEGEVDFEHAVPEGVEIEADESEVLIDVSNADWAS